jgi:hypothetical protein
MNLDEASLKIASELVAESTKLEKALPPKLAYRFRRWLQKFKYNKSPEELNAIKKALNEAIENLSPALKKNEARASFFDSGVIKMEFGGSVDKKVKEAAMAWAKKNNLKVLEASLEKSSDSNSSMVLGKEAQPSLDFCVKTITWKC